MCRVVDTRFVRHATTGPAGRSSYCIVLVQYGLAVRTQQWIWLLRYVDGSAPCRHLRDSRVRRFTQLATSISVLAHFNYEIPTHDGEDSHLDGFTLLEAIDELLANWIPARAILAATQLRILLGFSLVGQEREGAIVHVHIHERKLRL